MRHFQLLVPILALLGCNDHSNATGVSCADQRCMQGQVCCLDCDGRGSCQAPGSVCSGAACRTDGGTPDGGGLSCGNTTCSLSQICCIDCDGRGTCGAPGTVCTGTACLPDAAGSCSESCAGSTGCANQCGAGCTQGKLCCPWAGGACIPDDAGGCSAAHGYSCATPMNGVCPNQCYP